MAALMSSSLLSKTCKFTSFLSRSRVQLFHRASCLPAAYDAEFKQAQERLNTLQEAPDNQTKLKIYSLFKQATTGKCNIPKPGMMDMVGKAKWTAWSSLGDMTQDDAQQQYISLVNELAGSESPAEQQTTGAPGKYKYLKYSVEDGYTKITFNRPDKKNAFTFDMYPEIVQALQEAAENKTSITAITGSGDMYSSGNDLSNFMSVSPEEIPNMAKKGRDVLRQFVAAFIDFPKPLIAVVNGPAVGVAVTTLGLCDVVYATDRATFHAPLVSLGQSPEGCSSVIFPKLMGYGRSTEMILFGQKISAQTACDWGLVTRVFPDHSFQDEVWSRIKEMTEIPKNAARLSKGLIRGVDRETLHKANDAECKLLEERWQSDECAQAVMNFFMKKASKL